MGTTRTSDELKAEIQKTFGLLKTLRDETKVKVHLAGMDIKTAWDDLQPKLEEAEHIAKGAADSVTEATLEAMKATAASLGKIAASL